MATVRLRQKTIAVKTRGAYDYIPSATSVSATITPAASDVYSSYMYVNFQDPPASFALHNIESASLYAYLETPNLSSSGKIATITGYALTAPFSLSSGRDSYFNDHASFYDNYLDRVQTGYRSFPLSTIYGDYLSTWSVRNGVVFYSRAGSPYPVDSSYTWRVYADDAHPVYMDVVTGDSIVTASPTNLSPSGGFIDDRVSNVFSWDISPSFTNYIGTLSQSSAMFQWRVKGASTITSYECGTKMEYSVPAGTFPANGVIEWRVSLTDNGGHSATSEWVALSTTEELSSAVAVAPINTILTSAESIEFAWMHQIGTGTAPRGADLEYTLDGISYLRFANLDDSSLSYTAPPDTFPGGEIWWRVRTYNTDGMPGEWSEPVKFVSIGAPPAPALRVSASPRPIISWQSELQQAWQLQIPGVVDLSPEYGYTYSYKPNVIFDDGEYIARVRVMNTLGLWSTWAELPFTVENQPGLKFTIEASLDGSVVSIFATSTSNFDSIVVYRDGKAIGKISDNVFIDNLANGTHIYTARGLTGDNYSASNEVQVTVAIDTATIAVIGEFDWLDLPYSERQLSIHDLNYSKTTEFLHIYGAKYPIAEVSSFDDVSASIECAFIDHSDAKKLLAMHGKNVCLKLRRGITLVGPLAEITRTVSPFLESYQITVRNTMYSEEVKL